MGSDCTRIQEHLSEYLYDELTPPQTEHVRQHLSHCEACMDELDALYKTREIVDWHKLAAPVQPLPEDFVPRMWETIRYRDIRQDGGGWKRHVPMWSALAACLLVGVTVAFIGMQALLLHGPNISHSDMGIIEPLKRLTEWTPTPLPGRAVKATPTSVEDLEYDPNIRI